MISIACIQNPKLYNNYMKKVKELRKVVKDGYICTLEHYPTKARIPLAIHIWKGEELK